MIRWIVGLALIVSLAGCSAIPFGESTPQKEPAPVMLVNNATISETFEVAVVEVGKNITIHWRGNESENITVSQGSATLEKQLLRVEFPDSARNHGRYTLQPGDRKQISIKNVAPNEAIVITVYDKPEGTYRAIKWLNCGDGTILGYKVTTQAEGEDQTESRHQCG